MSSSGGGSSAVAPTRNCQRDNDCDSSSDAVVAQMGDGSSASLPGSISPEAERRVDACPEMSHLPPGTTNLPTKADWPSDLLYKLLVQSGVPINNCGNKAQGTSSQSYRGPQESIGNVATETHPSALAGKNNSRPDELISAVLEHILPGLKKSASPNKSECIDDNKIPWGTTRNGYTSSPLGEIKDAASARFALSMNKESSKQSKYIHLQLLLCICLM